MNWRFLSTRAWSVVPIAGASLVLLLNRNLGWLPNDDGTLMQSALRVGNGDLPHVDFHEPYTGGLTYFHAGVLSIFGESMASLRWPFLLAAVFWVISLSLIARRFMGPVAASLLVSSLALGSVLMHMSPIPSWYNLFLGTWSIHLVLKYVETDRARFLVASGALVGLSTLLKTTGVYFGMAVWVILLVAVISERGKRGRKVELGLAALPVLASFLIVSAELTIARFVALVVPIAVVVSLGLWIVLRTESAATGNAASWKPLGILLAVASVPPLAWFVRYVLQGNGQDLIAALTVVPSSFVGELSLDNVHPMFLLVPVAAMLSIRILASLSWRQIQIVVTLLLVGTAFLLRFERRAVLLWSLLSITSLGFVAAMLFCFQAKKIDLSKTADLALYAVTCGAVFFALIEFPHAGPYYYIYAFPLAAVATTGWSFRFGLKPGYMVAGLFVALSLLFGANKLSGAWFADAATASDRPQVSLQLDGFGLRVPIHYQFYELLVADINERVSDGQRVLAGPDSPEIYALTNADNPSPVLFELISRSIDPIYDSVSQLQLHRPDLYVLNSNPIVSEGVSDLRAALSDCALQDTYGFFELYECSWSDRDR